MNYTVTTIIFLSLITFTPSTLAVNHALLIGVSHYENPSIQSLNGPKNDVELMRKVLLKKGFDDNNIHILADGVDAKLPTRKNILVELDDLTKTVEKEDFVYLHFSGHGSQQPVAKDKSRTEPDGRDEIFLPRDAGNWKNGMDSVENAIVDDEIKIYLQKLHQKGAFVWVVFDSCHSGTMTKASLPINVRYRRVNPGNLGIPPEKFKTTSQVQNRDDTSKETTLGSLADNLVAFYAAQTTETTPEMPLTDKPQKIYGVFTYTLAQVLESYDNMTYRQAAQLTLNHYAAHNPNKTPTPLFEGSLDTIVFGKTQGQIPQQWLIEQDDGKLKINAGQLHQLAEGSILAVVPNPAAGDNETKGYVKITHTNVFDSKIKKIKYNQKSKNYQIPQGAYARLVAPKINLALTVALPPKSDGKINKTEVRARRVLKDLEAKKPDTCIKTKDRKTCVNVKWVKANNTSADLRLLFQSNELWLLPKDAELIEFGDNKTPSIDLRKKTNKQLHETLIDSFQRIAKVHNLLRLSRLMHNNRNNDDFFKVELRIDQGQGYKNFDISHTPTLYEGNKIKFAMENNRSTPVDVTMLYVDSEYGVEPMYPSPHTLEINRIEPNGHIDGDIHLSVNKPGMEYLIVISVQAKPKTMHTDFRFLSQPSIPAKRQRQGTDEQESLYDLFSEAVFGGDWIRRKGSRITGLRETTMQVFRWKTTLRGVVDTKLDRLLEKGEQAYQASNYSAALAKWQAGLKKARKNNYQRYLSKFLSKLGLVHYKLEQHQKALASFQEALEIQRKIHEKRGEANSLINLGEIHLGLQHYEQAATFFRQALKIGDIDTDDKDQLVDNWFELCEAYFNLEQYKKARECYQQVKMLR